MGAINAADLATSARLQRLLAFLRQRGPEGATTRDIEVHAEVRAVSAAVTELRANGIGVSCVLERRTATGESVYRYRLLSVPDDRPRADTVGDALTSLFGAPEQDEPPISREEFMSRARRVLQEVTPK